MPGPAASAAAIVAFVFGLGLFVAFAAVFGVSGRDLTGAVLGLSLPQHAAIAVTQALIIGMAAWKWRLLLREASDRHCTLDLRHATYATTLGTLAGQVLPLQLVTPAVRAWVARRHEISASRAVGTSAFEQLFDVIVLVCMVIAGLTTSVVGPALGLPLGAVILLIMVMSVGPTLGLGAATIQAANRLGLRFLQPLAPGMRQAQGLPRGLLVQLMGLSILRYGLMVWLNVQILAWFVPDIALLPLVLAFPLVQAMTALPIATGGLGVTEAAWVGILVASGLSAPEAAEAALALRIASTAGFLMIAPVLVAVGFWPGRRTE